MASTNNNNGVISSVVSTGPQTDVLCTNYTVFCPDFFNDTQNAVYVAYIIFRFILYSFILFLSYRIPKDFLKNFTLLIFVPLFFGEIARIGLEFVFYLKHFEVGVEGVSRMINAEIVFETMYNILSGFAYYAFLTESLVVYYGLFRAFLDPDGYEKCRVGTLFYGATILPLIIVLLMNLPWSGFLTDLEIYTKHSCKIALGIVMAFCYLFTVFRLSCRKQIRDTRIDDRSIIRRAKSRLIWFTIYMSFQNLVNFPGFVESILYLMLYSINSLLKEVVLLKFFQDVSMLSSIADEFRGVGLTICTLLFVPVYREAIFFCRLGQ
uniref:Uncharacterized protein n=1 Tax=Panagrolaimus sp. PS1159 TaxID=55785 RepID=A0AC35GD39_9BILA